MLIGKTLSIPAVLRLIEKQTDQADSKGNHRAKNGKSDHVPVSSHMMACSHILAHNNGACISKTAEEGKDKAFQYAECSHGCYGGFGLVANNDVDKHLSYTVKQFVADDGNTFHQVGFQEALPPVKHFTDF
jgi:hypothetical protein